MPYSLRSRRNRGRQNRGKPEPERNIPAAFFSLVVGGIFAVAMAEPNWLSISGGKCNRQHIGLYKIFGVGSQHHSEKTLKGWIQICHVFFALVLEHEIYPDNFLGMLSFR